MSARQYRQLDWTPDKVARFWDWQSQYPHQYFTYQFGPSIVSHVRSFLEGRQSVLDYGCGTGFLVRELVRLGCEVTGADYSRDSVAETNRVQRGFANFSGAFLVDDLLAQGRSFDATLCVEVVEHLYDPELDQLLANIRQLSGPDACTIFTTPNEEVLEENQVYCPDSDVVFHRYQHVRSWSAESLTEYLTSRGYTVLDAFATNLARRVVRGPLRWLRAGRDRLCGLSAGAPHLVCIARVR